MFQKTSSHHLHNSMVMPSPTGEKFMRKRLILCALLASAFCTAIAESNTIRLGPFQGTPQKKASVQEKVTGKVRGGLMGGITYFLETADYRQYIIAYSRDIPEEAEKTLDELLRQNIVVDMNAYVIKRCTKTEELNREHLGCNWLDTSKAFSLQTTKNDSEKAVLEALRLKNSNEANVALTKRAIKEYARTGNISATPDIRGDYNEYHFAKKHTFFMGHRFFMIRSEFMETYLGCCVKPAVEVAVLLDNDGDNLLEFAKQNRCSIKQDNNMAQTWKNLKPSNNFHQPKGNLALITCEAGK